MLFEGLSQGFGRNNPYVHADAHEILGYGMMHDSKHGLALKGGLKDNA